MPSHPNQSPVMPTLAQQSLPRHVRDLLLKVLRTCTSALEANVIQAIRDFEQTLSSQAEQTVELPERESLRAALAAVASARARIVAHFLDALEAELALLQSPVIVRGQMTSRARGGELSLVNDHEIEETSALTDAATRAELQNSLPLFLLGQRFGVLAGRPAFDAEALPVGPQALCRSIRRAVERVDLEVGVRLLLYRAFERNVMREYHLLVEQLNQELARSGVLPNLQYVPVRARRVEQNAGAGRSTQIPLQDMQLSDNNAGPKPSAATAQGTGHAASTSRPRQGRARTPSEERAEQAGRAAQLMLAMAATQGGALASDEGYTVLRQLLSGRRQLLGKLNSLRSREGSETLQHVVGANDLQEALRGIQLRPAAPVMSHGRSTSRTVAHVKQDMLALLRRAAPNQEAPVLTEEHNDAIDLVGMLYDNLVRDMKPNGAVANLLTKLQVPILRVALQDRSFFTNQDHPARQMLNAVAETGNALLGEDEADDPLVGQMNSIVDRAVRDYRGDPSLFHDTLNELLGHLQTLTRKADAAERRHVEAAMGKEKLQLAREHAADSVESLLKGQKLPRFTQTLLSQAWADVMALTALRQGADSPVWRQQMKVAEKLIEIAARPPRSPPPDQQAEAELRRDLEEGLGKIGFQEADASAISRRLLNPNASETDDDAASSRTELTLRLKAQARLGEDMQARKTKRIPLTSTEQVQLERLQNLPTGTVFEFTDADGAKVKRRLAWFSNSTGATLFVNQRGQKFTDLTMDALARQVAKGQALPIEEPKGHAIDRAWENVLNALRSFAVPEGEAPGAPGAETP